MMLQTYATPLLVLLLAAYSASADGNNSISCTTPGMVKEGDSAAVTCKYNQNVEINRQDFYIYKVKKDEGEAVIVAICVWKNANLNCDRKIDSKVQVKADTVKLNVTSAQLDHAGNYSCSTLPPKQDTQIEECSLSVQEKPAMDKVNISCNKDGGQASVTCMFPAGLDATTVMLQRYDLQKNSKPVEVMRCDNKKDECSSALPGYETSVRIEANNFKTFRVNIPSYASDKSGPYMCTADSESNPGYNMCSMKQDEVSTRPEPEKAKSDVPLYAILACLVLLLIIVLAFVIKWFIPKSQKRSTNPTKCNSSEAERGFADILRQRDSSNTTQYSVVATADREDVNGDC